MPSDRLSPAVRCGVASTGVHCACSSRQRIVTATTNHGHARSDASGAGSAVDTHQSKLAEAVR
ncbi:hypothetical protein OH76DRAFT_515472 [Lentinus brumalis]|uniref:Uncharacterized protein n=1 Tax=Lentinus brumalis TaxID=2498619 RepID=A0A371CHT0_9APHY|nr:hypothetical protein OH76DRAFT_515472 [Polyporus brumalis]